MTERSRWDSKRRSPLSDPRRSSHSSNSSRGSTERDKSHRDYRRERDYRHEKEKEKDYKKDRYQDHKRNHASDHHHRSSSRDRSSDSSSSHKGSRRDERRNSSHDHRSSSSAHHKLPFNHKHRDSPASGNYSPSPYATHSPSSRTHLEHTSHQVANSHPRSISHHIERPVTPPLPHVGSQPMLHSSLQALHSSGHHAVQSQHVDKSAIYNSAHSITAIPMLPSQHHIPAANMYADRKMNNVNRIDHRAADPRVPSLPKCSNHMAASKAKEPKRNFKLVIDPVIRKGHAKVVRYDGILADQPPVVPKDPRSVKNKIWSIETCDLPVPEFKIDRNYCGTMPKNVVRFSGLNDNINRKFLYELCESYGDIKEYKVYFDPKTNRHTGTGKVVFEPNTRTEKVIQALNGRPIMGNVITVWIDEKSPPGLPMMIQLQKECLMFRSQQAGYSHQFAPIKCHEKTRRLSTPPTPNISNVNRNHPVAQSYNHSPTLYAATDGKKMPGYYKNTDNSPPPPPPPKPNYENISPISGEQDRKTYSKSKYSLPYKYNDPVLSIPINRSKSAADNVLSCNSLSNAKRGISPISPVDATLTEKLNNMNYESISDCETAPQVEDISPAATPTVDVHPNDNDDDDAMSLSSISSNEDKVEVVATTQFLHPPNLTPNVQAGIIPISSQMSINQNMMSSTLHYGSNSNIYPNQQHRVPQPPALPQPRPPLQPRLPMQSHRPPPSHPAIHSHSHPSSQSIQPQHHTSPHQHLTNQQHPPLHQPSLPRQLPPQQHPSPHHTPPQQRMPSHNVPSINQSRTSDYRPVGPTQFNSRVSYQQYSNRSNPPPVRPNMLPPSTTNSRTDTNMEEKGKPSSNVQVLLPMPTSRKHAEILRNALSNIPGPSRPLNPGPVQSYSSAPPPVRPPPIIPKDLPFSFQVKSGCARDLSIELKRILAKDTLKKLVEHSAFTCFENWWEKQRSSRPQVPAANIPRINDTGLNRNLLRDKTSNMVTQLNIGQPIKDYANNTTPALLVSLFQTDKNNENRPPPTTTTTSTFLNSYRISRKSATQTNMKVSHISRKRRPWPSLNQSKRKLRRLEDSEDEDMEDEEEQTEDDEDNQLEQFALHQRQKQKSGSSLYQKIYSDESEDEDDEDVKGVQTQSDDEDEQEEPTERQKPDLVSSSSSTSSSESSDDSDLSSSSESEISESETEEEIIVTVDDKKEEHAPEPESKLPTQKKLSVESETEEESTQNEEANSDLSDSEKVTFRSMYDEPRRAAVQNAEKRMRELCEKLKTPKRPDRLKRSSLGENDGADEESSDDLETRKPLTEINRKVDKNSLKDDKGQISSIINQKDSIEKSIKSEFADKNDLLVKKEEAADGDKSMEEPGDDDVENKFIMLEHSYFFKSPSAIDKIESESETTINKSETGNNDILSLMDSKQLYRRDKHRFKMRTTLEETNIIWDIMKQGIDAEDLVYFKEAFESLQQIGAKAVDSRVWFDHPITIISPPKVKRGKVERIHKTGSARTEGYYKIPISEKAQYLKSALRQLSVLQQHNDQVNNASAQAGTEHHKIKSRENRAMQRRLASSIAQEDYGSLITYNQTLKTRKRALRFARSHIHNWGLFACEPIAAEEFVCEYIGQMIRSIVAELREQRYEKSGIGSSYLFRLDMDGVIDATKMGCNARFINHSCQPNCYAKVILVEGAKKIVIYSKRDIKVGEEITYDYKFPIEDDKIPCMCGTPQCRGSLN